VLVDTPRDLEALGSVLRNEKPIYYSENLHALRTGPEPPGEEEFGYGVEQKRTPRSAGTARP
jgi:hypothetical protein